MLSLTTTYMYEQFTCMSCTMPSLDENLYCNRSDTTLIMFPYFFSDTTVFVDRLFKGLDTESYLTGEDPPTIPSPPPKATVPPSSSRSSKGDSKNERSDTSSPLQSASRRPSEDIRQREVSCRTTFSLYTCFGVLRTV